MDAQPIVPKEYAGKWIAWNHNRTKIIGSGRTLPEVRNLVKAKKQDAVFAKAPAADVRFVGCT